MKKGRRTTKKGKKERNTTSGCEREREREMSAELDFMVKVSNNEVVAAIFPVEEHLLPLSNLDLLLPAVDVGVFFCYKKPKAAGNNYTFLSIISILKKALAHTLAYYYPFAAEMRQNAVGEPQLLCNNRGVNFIEAFADVELKDLNFYNPHENVDGKLAPKRKQGVLAIQVTQFKCGGFVVFCTFDHRVADAYSANMFLVSWAEMGRSKPPSQLPSFQRSLLFPRRPGFYDVSVINTYVPTSSVLSDSKKSQPEANDLVQVTISRIYYMKANQIIKLQSLANADNTNPGCMKTKLVAFSAFLWKTIAEGKYASNYDKNCRMGIVVDGRRRLINGDENKAKKWAAYFGNVLSIPFGEMKIDELKKKPINEVANAIHEFLQPSLTREHFLGLVDWVEAHRPTQMLAKMYAANVTKEEPAIVVSSGLHFPVRKMDFGWGKPSFGSYHFPWGGKAGYVMPMPSPIGNGDWVVYMHLLKDQLKWIETCAADVFIPLTSHFLNMHTN